MSDPFKISLVSHILFAGTALVIAPLAMVTAKGGLWHRRWGKNYFRKFAAKVPSPETTPEPTPTP